MSSSDTPKSGETTAERGPGSRGGSPADGQRSKVLREREFRWEGVPIRAYKRDEEADRFRDVTRQTLLGEGEGEEALTFLTRYFEIEPGGFSSLERHRHPHSVVVVRGRGQVVLAGKVHEIGPLDCVYVAPGQVHRFRATGDAPLGFLCVVDRERDRPEVVEDEATERGRASR